MVLEVLREDRTINEIAQSYEVHPKMLGQWKIEFLENASLAFDRKRGVNEYKEALQTSEKEKDELHRQIGKLTAEVNWAKKKSIEAGLTSETIFDNKD